MSQFPVFETIAILDGIPQNLAFHQVRMDNAIEKLFKQTSVFNLAEIIQVPERYQNGLVRCRIDYNQQDYHIIFSIYQKREIFKYSNRENFDLIKIEKDEAIIIQNGKVTDCRVGNLLFLKNNIWYSPKDYLLKGTQLSYLLSQNKIKLVEIKIEDLHQYEKIMMINAMNPFDESRAISTQHITL